MFACLTDMDTMAANEQSQLQFSNGPQSIGGLLDKYRPYLHLLAARQLDSILSPRMSPSDIVQQTQLEAFRDREMFRGESEEQFVAWLRAILSNTVARATHTHIVTKKRSVRREQAQPAEGGAAHELAREDESPSAAAIQGEAAVRLARAMEQLTEDQYTAIRLRYIEGCALVRIAETMNRSTSAVAGLLKRGLRGLRDQLRDEMADGK